MSIADASYSVSQTAGTTSIEVNRTGGSAGAISVGYATADATATSSADYTATSGTLDWADGDTAPKTVEVAIMNATQFTGTKDFTFALNSPSGGATVGSPNATVVTINGAKTASGGTPSSSGTVSLSSSTYSISQAAGAITVSVHRTGGSSGAASVKYATIDDTAKLGTDYSTTSGTLNWADGDTSAKNFSVPVSKSKPFAGTRRFKVILSSANKANLGSPSSATVTIDGSAAAESSLAFSAAAYSVGQSGGSLVITVNRTNGTSGAASVNYSTADGVAKAGAEYITSSGTLNWADGDAAPKTFSVAINKANSFAGTRAFSVTLSSPTQATLGTPSSASVTINGSAATSMSSLAFSASAYAVGQAGGPIVVTVNRSGSSSGVVSVTYKTTDNTAKAGTDYTAASGTLNWADGDAAAKTFTIAVSNAKPFSGSKAFAVALSGPTHATLDAPNATTVTINGSGTPGSLALSAAAFTVAQNAGTVVITANRAGGTSGAAAVNFATSDGTAKAGTDYTAGSGTLQWADGDGAAKTLNITVSNAKAFTGTKTFNVTLAGASKATLGNPSSAVVTISGTGAALSTLNLSSSAYTVSQSAGSLVVSVTRTGSTSGAVSVGYGTADNTAKAGTDYTAASGVLNWADADGATKSFSIPVSKATLFAGSKAFAIAISSPSANAQLGTVSSAVATISGSSTSLPAGAMGPAAASRLLTQATFGPTIDSVNAAAAQTYDQWFTQQMAAAPSLLSPSVPSDSVSWYPFWMKNAVKGQDQLRQRVAFALSEIFVTSYNVGILLYKQQGEAHYYDLLSQDAFGNFRNLLQDVTLSLEMGQFLSMYKNAKANPAIGSHADENYAREVMQLFTVGLVKLNIDGSVQTDSSGTPIPTYGQDEVTNLARVFSGWASVPTTHTGDMAWQYSDADYLKPMIAYPAYHDTDPKTIIGGVAVPGGGTAEADLKIALDTLFNHPNVGPFISKQLIQRLVTSNPSAAYVARVANVFNNNGQNVRGDLGAVVKAILTDPEALTATGQGKMREPLLRTLHLWRAFNAGDTSGNVDDYQVEHNSMAIYDQAPLQSPSVFNFFRPDYERAGPLTDAGLVAPEFQILNESSLVNVANENLSLAYQYVDSTGTRHAGYQGYSEVGNTSAQSVMLNTAQWESYAADPATLVDEFNLILMEGAMPAAMRTTLINYLTTVPANTPWSRVNEAAELIINSPQYSIQR